MNDATRDDIIRDAEVFDTTGFDLTTKQVEVMFADAGVPRSLKTIQRYCNKGYLLNVPYETENGTLFRINRDSVERRIREIQQVQATQDGRDISRPATTAGDSDAGTTQATIDNRAPRQATTPGDIEKSRGVSSSETQHGIDSDMQGQATTVETRRGVSPDAAETMAALREQLEIKEGSIQSLRTDLERVQGLRQTELEFIGQLQTFVKAHVQEVFDERDALRQERQALLKRVQELEALPPARQTEVSTRNPAPADIEETPPMPPYHQSQPNYDKNHT